MKIVDVVSHVLKHDLSVELGYSQKFYKSRTAHLVEVRTDEGLTGWGECFGPGDIALANKGIVEKVIKPMVRGMDPLGREVIWHKVYNLLRDHGQKGMPLQALSGVDIALWDIAGKAADLPISTLIGGRFREKVPVYGYGMMLRKDELSSLCSLFADEAKGIKDSGFAATKMKIGLGPEADIKLAQAVRRSIDDDFRFMVDANHCYATNDAFYVGRALEELDAYWFEEPVAPEDLDGYRDLRTGLKINIAGGEAEFTRWGWRHLLESRCLDIAQPEVCAVGGISEFLKVQALAHTHFTPIVNHVWGSDISIAANLQLLAAMPPVPGGMCQSEPYLEFDTTENHFRDGLLKEPLNILTQVAQNNGYVSIPNGPGLGVEPDTDFIRRHLHDC